MKPMNYLLRLRWAWVLLTVTIVLGGGRVSAAPDDKLIDKLLTLSKSKMPLDLENEKDPLRKLLATRYNVAIEELKQRCEDFKKSLALRTQVIDAARHLLQAELDLQTGPEGRVKVLEGVVELIKWYEGQLEEGLKAEVGLRAELLRVRYERLTFEIELLKARQEMEKGKEKPGAAR
jgi:hypothetical protein